MSETTDYRDPLERMTVYRIARKLREHAFEDAAALLENEITAGISAQLYKAVGSINANIAEGYAKSSGRDRARIFEIALGSARESQEWYDSVLPVLGQAVVADRRAMIAEIRRLLQAIIPRERDRTIRKVVTPKR